MNGQPEREHHWLHTLVGSWEHQSECQTGPDSPPSTSSGTAEGRSLGGLWVVVEGRGETPEGEGFSSILTLGFDSTRKRFVGTFVASVMTYLWIYDDGHWETPEGRLILPAEGPAMDGTSMMKYEDSIEIVDSNLWILKSRMWMQDQWVPFMKAEYRRTGTN